jgi:hypothetical protein
MEIYTVMVVASNGTEHIYTVLARQNLQAILLAKRYHNRTMTHDGYRADTAKVKSHRRLRPGVLEFVK